jgi:hypothetical protein
MARLQAHGTEVLRLEKRTPTPEDEYVSERRDTISVRSDGSVLRKHGAVERPHQFNPQAQLRGGKWKVMTTAKQARERGHTPDRWRERLLAAGYQQVHTPRE